MKLKRILFRSRVYYTLGVSIISLPITFLGFARNLYNFVDNVPYLYLFFPDYATFVWRAGIGLLPISIFVGYLFTKSPFYAANFEITAQNNPYAWKLAPGRDSKLYFGQLIGAKNMLRLYQKMGVIPPKEEEDYRKFIDMMEHLNKGGRINDV